MRRADSIRYLALAVPLLLTACATIGPPLPPSLDLPKPPLDLRATRKGDRLTLTWTLPTMTTDRQTIRTLGPTRICRSTTELKDCGTPVGQIPGQTVPSTSSAKQKAQSSYTEAIPDVPSENVPGFVNYAVEVLNKDGRGAGISNQVRIPTAHTLAPPQDFQARVTARGIVLTWSAGPSPAPKRGLSYVYRIYRSAQDSSEPVLVGETPIGDEHSFSFTDTTFEWEKTYNYRAETLTLIEQSNEPKIEVEGDETPTVKIFADDVFPPSVPAGLQAVFSGPGQKRFIDLIWAPVTDADLTGYNVYRGENGRPLNKVNSELVRAPAYRDTEVQADKRYSYAVTSVDQRGNESARSETASESVP